MLLQYVLIMFSMNIHEPLIKLWVPHLDPSLKTSSPGLSVFSARQDGLVMLYPECLEYDIGKDGLVMGTVTQYHRVPNISPSPKQLIPSGYLT